MKIRIRSYVYAISVAACIALAVLIWILPTHTPRELEAVATLAVLAILAELLSHQLASGAAGSIAFVPLLASALLVPNWMSVVAAAGSLTVPAIVAKKDPFKLLFNVSQVMLALSVGVILFVTLGGSPFLRISNPLSAEAQHLAIPFLALVFAFFSINTLLVSGAIAVSQGRRVGSIWRQNLRSSLLNDILSSPIVLLFAWTYTRFGVWGVVLLTLPLLGVRQLYRANHQLEKVNQELLELMVKAIEARDPYTSGHSRRVAHYSKLIARAMGLNSKEVERIATAALLHDVGKIHEIYAPILRKPGKLTPDEWTIMQTHSTKSAELVSTVSHFKDLVEPVRHHHENWDGTGYPDGLAGEGIPLGARVILVADTIDAMTTDRPYRKALTEVQVREELFKYSGTQFDPGLCDTLLNSPMFSLLFAPVAERTPTPASPPRVALVRPA